MPYAQIHTHALGHPKILALSATAFRVWIAGLCYAQEHLTDGALSRVALVALRVPAPVKAVAELEAQRLWEVTADGWLIHDYTRWNRTRADVEDKREQDRERMRDFRAKRHAVAKESRATRQNVASPQPQPQPQPQEDHTQEPVCDPPHGGNSINPTRVQTLWEHWQEAASGVNAPVSLVASWKECIKIDDLIAGFPAITDEAFRGAMVAFWQDGKVSHNLGMFRSRLPDLLARTGALTKTNWRDRCPHDPPCGTPEQCEFLQVRGEAVSA